VLDQVQPDHQAGRQAGPTDAVAVERAEGDSEALPVDQAGQTDQGWRRSTRFSRAERNSSGCSDGGDFGGIGGLLRGDAPSESRRPNDCNRGAVLPGFACSGQAPCNCRYFPKPENRGNPSVTTLFTGDSVGQALADALPHAHFHVLRDCGHLPTLEEPAECAVLFFEFLDDKTQHARD
jgi:pimeloyl-ACP methyl ester carboxylesterase